MIKGVPCGVRKKVKDTFVSALETNLALANNRVIRTWITWDGDDKTVNDPPPVDMMPAVQIRIVGGPSKRICSAAAPGQARKFVAASTLTAVIDLYTKGPDAGDSASIADLIVQALAPQEANPRTALNERFREAGIKRCVLVREIMPAAAESFSLESVHAQGAYDLIVQFYE